MSVEADASGNTEVSGPTDSTVTFMFGKTAYTDGLTFKWYDGGRMPPQELFDGFELPPVEGKKGGAKAFDLVMVGTEGKFSSIEATRSGKPSPKSLLEDFDPPTISIPRVENEDVEWIEACKGGQPALSTSSTPVRSPRRCCWERRDPHRQEDPLGPGDMKAKGCPEADPYIQRAYRKGWEL